MITSGKVTVGYIGCGVMGQVYMRAAQALPFIRSGAVMDLNQEQARKVAVDFGIDKVHSSAEALIEDSAIDAVVLAIPAALRAQYAILAFRAGKHVLIEKPVAMNADEVQRMMEERGDRVAGCCSARLRCQDSADAVSRIISSGRLGEIRVIRSRWQTAVKSKPEVTPPLWRLSKSINGGGNLANLGSYALDYLLGVTGWELEPDHISARTWTIPELFMDHVAPGSDGETLTTAMITFKNGPVLMLEQGEFAIGKQESIGQVVGTQGTLSFRMVPSKQVIVLDYYEDGAVKQEVIWEGEENFAMMQQRLLADFAQAILQGHDPKTSLEQAFIVRRIIDAVYDSASKGHSIPFQSPSFIHY